MVTGRGDNGCIFCGNAKLDTLKDGTKYCDQCKKRTVEAEIKEYGVRY